MTRVPIDAAPVGSSSAVECAVRALVASLDHETASALAASPASLLHRFHFGLGMTIRNRFALWEMQGALYDDLSHRLGGRPFHPDEASEFLLRLAWREIRRQRRRPRGSVRVG